MSRRRAARQGKPSNSRDAPLQLLQAAIDEVADLVAICDARGRLVFVNPAARGLALDGAAGDELDASIWGEWHDADDRLIAPTNWPLQRALRGESRIETEG